MLKLLKFFVRWPLIDILVSPDIFCMHFKLTPINPIQLLSKRFLDRFTVFITRKKYSLLLFQQKLTFSELGILRMANRYFCPCDIDLYGKYHECHSKSLGYSILHKNCQVGNNLTFLVFLVMWLISQISLVKQLNYPIDVYKQICREWKGECCID